MTRGAVEVGAAQVAVDQLAPVEHCARSQAWSALQPSRRTSLGLQLGRHEPRHPAAAQHDALPAGAGEHRAGQLAVDQLDVEQPQVGQLEPREA